MFKKPVSVNYPDQKVPMFPKWRGKQVLMRDENGLEKCVACGLCAVACPADAIYLEAAENDGSVAAGPRYAKVYQIHKTRCIFCGYCEEACPVSAIFMGKDYELAVYSNKDFIWDKQDLLVPAPGGVVSAAGLPPAASAKA
jgi:NADH-quinone oxidoreductase subunit I